MGFEGFVLELGRFRGQASDADCRRPIESVCRHFDMSEHNKLARPFGIVTTVATASKQYRTTGTKKCLNSSGQVAAKLETCALSFVRKIANAMHD